MIQLAQKYAQFFLQQRYSYFQGKHFNGHWQNIHYGDNRISLKQNQKWPQYQNLFADEFTIKEDDIYAQYRHRLANWAKVRVFVCGFFILIDHF